MKKLRKLFLMSLFCQVFFTNKANVNAAEAVQNISTNNSHILISLLLISVATNVLLLRILVAYKSEYKQKNEATTKLQKESNAYKDKISKLNSDIHTLKLWKDKVKKAVSNIDELVELEVKKEEAESFNQILKRLLKATPNNETYQTLISSFDKYENLSSNEKKFITVDMSVLEEKMNVAKNLYVAEATKKLSLSTTVKAIASEHTYWEEMLNYYNKLPVEIQTALPSYIVGNFFAKYQEAIADYNYSPLRIK